MPGIAVVHLVRRQNGLAPLERFLESYRAHPAGVPHELVILFKGFRDKSGTEGHDSLLAGLAHRRMFVPDKGFDVNAYFAAVEQLDYDHFCFLNSYSRILDQDWLEKLFRWIGRAEVGLVGATGSWQSIAGGYSAYHRRISAAPPAARFRIRVARALRDGALLFRSMVWLSRMAGIWRPARDFPPYPNYHLRTNAFMGSRQILHRVRISSMRTKLAAYRFESGIDGLTKQVMGMNLKVLVVGRDGEAYDPECWHLSNTYWQSLEENLLVADNQTEKYLAASPEARAVFSQDAWGDLARLA